jgi:hypothetical protein
MSEAAVVDLVEAASEGLLHQIYAAQEMPDADPSR